MNELIQRLIAEGRLDEAKIDLKKILEAELTEAERADLLIGAAEMEMKMDTAFRDAYASLLEQAAAEYQGLDKAEAEIDRQDKLAQIRKDVLGK